MIGLHGFIKLFIFNVPNSSKPVIFL